MQDACGMCKKLEDAASSVVFENELWHVRPIDEPSGVPGWMMLVARRHVPGPAHFNAREVASFGPTWCHLQRVLLDVTGALRIYSAAMGESSPHFHGHLVPRFTSMPKDAKDIWAILTKAGVPRYAELVAFSDDPGEAAANYFVLKLMGYPDIKVLVM